MCDKVSSLNVEDLSSTIAASRNTSTIMAEANTANNRLVRKSMYQINLKTAFRARIVYRPPFYANFLVLIREMVYVQLSEGIANIGDRSVLWGWTLLVVGWRSWHMGARRTGKWHGSVGLRRSSTRRTTGRGTLSETWRGTWKWGLRAIAWHH